MDKDIHVDYKLIEAQFFQDLARYGIIPRKSFTPVMDGKIHRFSTAQDKGSETSGAYLIHMDSWPTWCIQDYRQHGEMIKCKFNTGDLSTSEKSAIFQTVNDPVEQQRRAAEKAKEEQLQRENEVLAVQNAWREYNESRNSCAGEHPYSKLKHITAAMYDYRARIKTTCKPDDKGQLGDLMIPLRNLETGKFQALQLIRVIRGKLNLNESGSYQKGIYKNTHIKGAGFVLWPHELEDCRMCENCLNLNCPKNQAIIDKCLARCAAEREKRLKTILICEGIATACSLYYVLNFPTIAAINAGQIPNVARITREKFPNAKIIIAADNDEAGLKAANEAIEAGYANAKSYPEQKGKDWNDYYVEMRKI